MHAQRTVWFVAPLARVVDFRRDGVRLRTFHPREGLRRLISDGQIRRSVRCSFSSWSEDVSMPYRIRNPTHGVTDTLRSEPPASIASPRASPSGRFSGAVYFAAAEMLALEGLLEPALRAAERGMKLEPPEPEAQALYAWLLYRCDRARTSEVSAAVWSQIDRALERDASCALAQYFKSVLLQRAGQAHQARWHLQRGRELDPDKSAADRVLALLDDE
jgi:hypothetical protein